MDGRRLSIHLLLAAAAAVVLATPVVGATLPPALQLSAGDPMLATTLRNAAPGTRVEIAGVRLAERPQKVTLELERFDAFTPDAVVEVHGPKGVRRKPAPHPPMYRGTVAGDPHSVVFFLAGADRPTEGFARTMGHTLRLSDATDGRLELSDDLAAELAAATPYHCDTAQLPPPAAAAKDDVLRTQEIQATAPGPWYGVEVAVETDAEFYNLFGSVAAATNYVAVLFGGSSAIYRADLDVNLVVNYLSLWTGGTNSDPWSYSDTCHALVDLGNYWHTNHPMASLPRDTVHLLSGRVGTGFNSGLAWIGVLTAPDHSQTVNCGGTDISTYSGGYGVVTSIAANYHPTNSSPVWDIVAVSHEIGHNFNSPHTHCYNDIPNSGDPAIDHCYSGEQDTSTHVCYTGPTSVPSGGGSIMSYCQMLAGGLNNINLSFGAAGLYGTNSERVPQRMRAHVDSVSSGLDTTIFWDGFESDGTYFWSSTTP